MADDYSDEETFSSPAPPPPPPAVASDESKESLTADYVKVDETEDDLDLAVVKNEAQWTAPDVGEVHAHADYVLTACQ